MKMKRLVLAITLASLAALPHRGAQDRCGLFKCPTLSVSCPDTVISGTPVTFTANVSGVDANAELTFNWVVSAGTISSGQTTSSITVDTTGVPLFTSLTATVEVAGLPEECPQSASCATSVPGIIDHFSKVDEYGNLRWGDEKARLDNFAIEVRNDPEALGYIVGYGGRRSRRGEALRRIGRAKRYLVAVRGIDASRVLVMDGGYREELTVELWVRPKGAQPPQPSPTVDPNEVEFIKPPTKRRARRR